MNIRLSMLVLTMTLCLALPGAALSQAMLDQAKKDMQTGRYAAAIEILQQTITDRHGDYQAWFLFGVAHAHEQQYSQAIEAFRQVISLRPDLAEPHNNLAAVYNALGDPRAAVRELELALVKRPDYVVAEENIANLYVELALRHYRSSLEQAANPVIEQRYARLLNVRNPIGARHEKVAKVAKVEPKTVEKSAVAAKSLDSPPATPPRLAEKSVAMVPPEPEETDLNVGITGVLDALEAWRLAWVAQDLASYFSAYAADYQPEARFASISAWKKYKTRVIQNKKYIKVDLEKVHVDMQKDKGVATVDMLQRFRSNSYNGDDLKRITMQLENNQWRIISETSVK